MFRGIPEYSPVIEILITHNGRIRWHRKQRSYKNECKYKNVSRQMYSFLEVKLRRLRRKTYEDKNMISVIRIYILYLHAVLIKRPGPASQNMMQVRNIFTVNFIFCPSSKQILGDISCFRNEPKQCINTWQTTEVLNSAKRHADNSGNHANL